MDYLVHPSVSEEIDNCEADPFNFNVKRLVEGIRRVKI